MQMLSLKTKTELMLPTSSFLELYLPFSGNSSFVNLEVAFIALYGYELSKNPARVKFYILICQMTDVKNSTLKEKC